MTNWREWFEEMKKTSNDGRRLPDGYCSTFTEQQYQAFKARMIEELKLDEEAE